MHNCGTVLNCETIQDKLLTLNLLGIWAGFSLLFSLEWLFFIVISFLSDRLRNNAGAFNMYGLLLEHQKLFLQAEKAFERLVRFSELLRFEKG